MITGIGILPVYAEVNGSGTLTDYEFVEANRFAIGGAFMTVGYRLQPLRNGLMLQMNWNPMFLRRQITAGWIGIGIGMGFK